MTDPLTPEALAEIKAAVERSAEIGGALLAYEEGAKRFDKDVEKAGRIQEAWILWRTIADHAPALIAAAERGERLAEASAKALKQLVLAKGKPSLLAGASHLGNAESILRRALVEEKEAGGE